MVIIARVPQLEDDIFLGNRMILWKDLKSLCIAKVFGNQNFRRIGLFHIFVSSRESLLPAKPE
jgi:hypothetical protein